MSGESLTDALRETLAVFGESGTPRTTTEVAESLDLGRRSTYERLERLADRDQLRTKKVGASARVWWRTRAASTTDVVDSDPKAVAESVVEGSLDDDSVGAVVLDDEFDVVWINDDVERYFGVAREDVVGRDKRRLVEERFASAVENPDRFADSVLSTYDDNSYVERFECHVTGGEGREERWLEHRSRPITSGEFAGGRVELYHDVSAWKRSERTRRRDREQFESMVETVEEYAIFTLDAEGRVETWNRGAERIKGYAGAEILGAQHAVFYTSEDRDDGRPGELLDRAAERGSVEDEGWRVRADGSRFWADVTITAIRDEDGELDGYAEVTRDASERREYERQLEAQAGHLERQREGLERELDEVFERIQDGFVALDGELRFTYANDRATDVLEIPASDFTGRYVWDVLDPTSGARETFDEAVASTESKSFEQYDESRNTWFEYHVYPSESGVSVYFRDVTERKEREQELERQASLLDTLFEQIPVNLYVKDEDGRHLRTSSPYLREEYPDEEWFRGKTDLDIYSEEIASEAYADDMRVVESGESIIEKVEYDPSKDDWLLTSKVPWYDDDGEVCGLIGVSRVITEQKEREFELERYEAVMETVDDGVYAVDADGRFVTVNDAFCQLTGYDRAELVGAHVSMIHEDDVTPRAKSIATEIVEGKRDIETLELDIYRKDGDSVPCEGRLTPFPVEDGYGRCGVVRDVSDRIGRERELAHRRQQLEALNNVNKVFQEISDAVIDESTREEIEETVCERLASADSYLFAWMGDVDVTDGTVSARTEAGVDGYLDEVTITVDPDDERSEGPTGRAFRTGEIQTTRDVHVDDRHAPWRDHVEEYGMRSSAAIPIVHEDSVYGVLNVYAGRPNAFDGKERELLAQLGEVVGHAIAATERKRALMSDEVVELEFQIPDVFAEADADIEATDRMSLVHALPVEDDEFVVYGTTTADARDSVTPLVDAIPYWKEVTFREDGDDARFELLLSDPPILSLLASLGGSVEEAVIEDGDYHMRIQLAPDAEVRRVIEAVQDAYPAAEMLTRRQTSRGDRSKRVQQVVAANLTDRQRTALEAAYHSGFFEWPRNASGEDVSQSLGVSSPTFHQHLRKAEGKVFDALLSGPSRP